MDAQSHSPPYIITCRNERPVSSWRWVYIGIYSNGMIYKRIEYFTHNRKVIVLIAVKEMSGRL